MHSFIYWASDPIRHLFFTSTAGEWGPLEYHIFFLCQLADGFLDQDQKFANPKVRYRDIGPNEFQPLSLVEGRRGQFTLKRMLR